jgi:hypothetical protein
MGFVLLRTRVFMGCCLCGCSFEQATELLSHSEVDKLCQEALGASLPGHEEHGGASSHMIDYSKGHQ